jgi:hypothetical protein
VGKAVGVADVSSAAIGVATPPGVFGRPNSSTSKTPLPNSDIANNTSNALRFILLTLAYPLP